MAYLKKTAVLIFLQKVDELTLYQFICFPQHSTNARRGYYDVVSCSKQLLKVAIIPASLSTRAIVSSGLNNSHLFFFVKSKYSQSSCISHRCVHWKYSIAGLNSFSFLISPMLSISHRFESEYASMLNGSTISILLLKQLKHNAFGSVPYSSSTAYE